MQRSAQMAGVPEPLALSWGTVSQNDWMEPIKAAFTPVEVTEKLWIVPQPDPSGLSRCTPTACPGTLNYLEALYRAVLNAVVKRELRRSAGLLFLKMLQSNGFCCSPARPGVTGATPPHA